MGRILIQWPRSNYGTIIADPPWPLRGGKNGKAAYSKTMSADVQYPLMSFKQIQSLRVSDVAMPDSHLYLWAVSMYLPEALDTMRAWGFRYVTNLSWHMDDESVGLGQYFRTKHQLCLFGVKGRPPYARSETGKRPCVDSSFASPRRRHSQKPWDSWGNELLK